MSKTRTAPTPGALHEAALRHLARYAATEAGLVRVLDRRIARWQREAEESEASGEAVAAAHGAARAVARALTASGLINDTAFAEARAKRLVRAGRSRMAVAAHLQAKGIDASVAGSVLPADELPAALALVRRRRFGPFRAGQANQDPAQLQRELAVLARAGFGREVAMRALQLPPDEAETLLLQLKRG